MVDGTLSQLSEFQLLYLSDRCNLLFRELITF